MTLPIGYARVTHVFAGLAVPTGAVVQYVVKNNDDLTAQAIANLAQTNWGGTMQTSQVTTVNLARSEVKMGPDDTGASATSAGAAVPGTSGGTAAPPNVAFLAIKTTASGGRRGRGRMFIPGVNESGVDPDGAVLSANLIQLQTDLDDLLDAWDTVVTPMCLEHFPATTWTLVGGQPRRVPVAGAVPDPSTITSLTASSKVATQRRRLRR